jgi:hypothetical protein
MTPNIPDEVLSDAVAVSMACAVAAANKRARELGIDADQCLITMAQRPNGDKTIWRVNYGAKNYIGRRGGDLVIDVNPADCSIEKVLRGQ